MSLTKMQISDIFVYFLIDSCTQKQITYFATENGQIFPTIWLKTILDPFKNNVAQKLWEIGKLSRFSKIVWIILVTYSYVSNKHSVSNKCVVVCFFTLLHELKDFGDFWPIYSSRRCPVIIRYLKVKIS